MVEPRARHSKSPESVDSAAEEEPHRDLSPGTRYCFESLSHGCDEVQIEHAGQLYRLKRTRNGKLLLNK